MSKRLVMMVGVLVLGLGSLDASAEEKPAPAQPIAVNPCASTPAVSIAVPYAFASYTSLEAVGSVSACPYVVDANVAPKKPTGPGPAVIHFSIEPTAGYVPTSQATCTETSFSGKVEVSTPSGWQKYGAQVASATGVWTAGHCEIGLKDDAIPLHPAPGFFRITGRAERKVNGGATTYLPMVVRISES